MKTDLVRTLFITRRLPYPPIGGAPLRNWQNINIMMEFGPVAVFSIANLSWELNHPTEFPPGVALWSHHQISNRQPSLREKIGYWLRQPGWLRIYRLLNINLNIDQYYSQSIAQKLEQVLVKFQPHCIVFEELWLYLYLPIVKHQQCQIILDTHNVETHSRREIYKEAFESLKSRVKTNIRLTGIKSLERDFVRQAHQVWVCSDEEVSVLQDFCGQGSHIEVVPNGVDVAQYESVRLGYCSIPSELEPNPWTLIFTASFGYRPNLLAAHLLIDQVYPRLKAVYPSCRLLLVGVDPSQSMRKAAEQESGLLVTGKVPDIRPYLSASSVVIVPILHGGGTRLKILEAFAAGRPVVSTSKGAEGLKVRDQEHLLIGNNPEELAAGVLRLWSEASLSEKLAHSAYELVRMEYSWEAVGQRVKPIVQKLSKQSQKC